jgi:16S rRNA (guanine1207-N2)-methyltransferase
MTRRNKATEHYFTRHPKLEMRLGLIRTRLRGGFYEFLTASGVFSKRRVDPGTRLLTENMILPKDGSVLDIGCGYGVVGIVAASFNPGLRVFLVDVNKRAVWLAKQNVIRNQLHNVEVKHGLLYEPVSSIAFGCILSNPPISAGIETVKQIIDEAPTHMISKAVFQMVVRSKVGGKRLRTLLENSFGNVEILARKSGYRVFISKKQ